MLLAHSPEELMSLLLVYTKIMNYYKWKVLVCVILLIAVPILVTCQIQYTQAASVTGLDQEMTGETKVILYQQLQNADHFEQMTYFFNGISFSVMGLVAMGAILLIRVTEESRMRKRVLCSPVRERTLLQEELLVSLLLIPFVWLIHMVTACIYVGSLILSYQGIMMLINIVMLSITGIGLAFLSTRITKDRITMGVTLIAVIVIMCFVSGGFVPSYYLGNTARECAVFTPVYWYVKANELIRGFYFSEYTTLLEILKCFGMQLVFAVMYYVAAYADQKRRES